MPWAHLLPKLMAAGACAFHHSSMLDDDAFAVFWWLQAAQLERTPALLNLVACESVPRLDCNCCRAVLIRPYAVSVIENLLLRGLLRYTRCFRIAHGPRGSLRLRAVCVSALMSSRKAICAASGRSGSLHGLLAYTTALSICRCQCLRGESLYAPSGKSSSKLRVQFLLACHVVCGGVRA